jgi:hypothetical protein
MKRLFILLLLVVVTPSTAQSPPYLYYYSRLLGGIIIERADGTDSRIIGQDVIPAGLTGITGAGWSPSGKYFAVTGVNYEVSPQRITRTYIIDLSGEAYFPGLTEPLMPKAWSSDDKLMLVSQDLEGLSEASFWLLDVENEGVLSHTGFSLNSLIAHSATAFQWQSRHVVFYIHEHAQQYFKIMMGFDGSFSKTPVAQKIFQQHYTPVQWEDTLDRAAGEKVSPGGMYEAKGYVETILTNLRTGEAYTLPRHSQGTFCRDYLWNNTEEYIVTVDGRAMAGGGCGGWTVLGVTDHQGKLWRELGGCSWDSRCAGWLPAQVDLSSLPAGQPEPVQLEPTAIELSETHFSLEMEISGLRLRCDDGANRFIVDIDSSEVVYALYDTRSCPYISRRDVPDEWRTVTVAYEPEHQLLATALDYGNQIEVDIWAKQKNVWILVNQLTSQGIRLEFTPDGEYLRARNTNGWKIYRVEDILRTASEIK